MSQESLLMGYERMMIATFFVVFFAIAGMVLVARGQYYDNAVYFWSGLLIMFFGVMSLLGWSFWKFAIEFNGGFLLYNIMYGGGTKPIQETIYYEEIEEVTNPHEREDLSRFVKPGNEYLLPQVNSAHFYYTRLRHKGDRPNGGWAETDYITLLPFTQAIQHFSWNGSWICENFPRLRPKLSITYGEYRGTRDRITERPLSRLESFFEKLGIKDYDTRSIDSVPVYFVHGCTATANYANLIQKVPHLEMEWIEKNARGVQSADASDYESEIGMLYDIIENDKRLLAKKLSPAFYETPMIENNDWKSKAGNTLGDRKTMIPYLLTALALGAMGYLYFTGRLML